MTDTANLEDGFYWVRYGGVWEIARYYGGRDKVFSHPQVNGFVKPQYFDEIDPRPIKREDVK